MSALNPNALISTRRGISVKKQVSNGIFVSTDGSVELDTTLSVSRQTAHAKAVGDAIHSIMGSYIKDLDVLIGGDI